MPQRTSCIVTVSQPDCHGAPFFPTQEIMPNRAAVVADLKDRGLMPPRAEDVEFRPANLGLHAFNASLSSHQRAVDEAKAHLHRSPDAAGHGDTISSRSTRLRQIEDDFKFAVKMQREEEYLDFVSATGSPRDHLDGVKPDDDPMRFLWTRNRSTGGKPPKPPKPTKREEQQQAAKLAAVEALIKGTGSRPSRKACPTPWPGTPHV